MLDEVFAQRPAALRLFGGCGLFWVCLFHVSIFALFVVVCVWVGVVVVTLRALARWFGRRWL